MERPVTAGATLCATLVDEWIRGGVRHAFVAPGSRSTPLALAVSDRPEVAVHVLHDERSASFAALGVGLESGRPAVAICSSGTAGAHMHAAVIEASLMGIPLIVCTADRPPELWDVGAPQVVDQTALFGRAVRHFVEPGVADALPSTAWRSIGSRMVAEALGTSGTPGPVHANLSFRDPLSGRPDELPAGRPDDAPWHRVEPAQQVTPAQVDAAAAVLLGRSGIIVAGTGVTDPAGVLALGDALGWPVLADHQSGCRVPGRSVVHYESLLRSNSLLSGNSPLPSPQAVLRFGSIGTSKPLAAFTVQAANGGAPVVVARNGPFSDPDRVAGLVVPEAGLAVELLRRLPEHYSPSVDVDIWRRADESAAAAVDTVLADSPVLTETDVARRALQAPPTGGAVVVASSMPIRETEWFCPGRTDITVYANRGANGIDGTIATGIGVALAPRPTVVLVGDVAFLHDASSLTALAQRAVDLTIVVIDNDGGGIFGFLPQRDHLRPEEFEVLFGTPHGTDIAGLARAHGLATLEFADWDGAVPIGSGPRVVVARTSRAALLDVHGHLHQAVAAALASLPAE